MDYPFYFNLNPNNWSAYGPMPNLPGVSGTQQNVLMPWNYNNNNNTNQSQNGTEEISCSSQAAAAKGKSYEKWTKEEEQMLVDHWVENHELIESKESRKTWGRIVEELNQRAFRLALEIRLPCRISNVTSCKQTVRMRQDK